MGRGVQTPLGNCSFVKPGGHHVRHQQLLTPLRRERGQKEARRAVLQVSICSDVWYPQETPPPTAHAGLPACVCLANTAEGQQRGAGVQAEALLWLSALRRAGGMGREEGDPWLCRAGQLGGYPCNLWWPTQQGWGLRRVSRTNSNTLYD